MATGALPGPQPWVSLGCCVPGWHGCWFPSTAAWQESSRKWQRLPCLCQMWDSHFCHILLIRSESPSPARTPGQRTELCRRRRAPECESRSRPRRLPRARPPAPVGHKLGVPRGQVAPTRPEGTGWPAQLGRGQSCSHTCFLGLPATTQPRPSRGPRCPRLGRPCPPSFV